VGVVTHCVGATAEAATTPGTAVGLIDQLLDLTIVGVIMFVALVDGVPLHGTLFTFHSLPQSLVMICALLTCVDSNDDSTPPTLQLAILLLLLPLA
jgi:hypothetical protein